MTNGKKKKASEVEEIMIYELGEMDIKKESVYAFMVLMQIELFFII